MNSFNPNQIRALSGKLDRTHVRTRKAPDGSEISYLEGWFVIAEANAVFGFGGWDRQSVHFDRVFEHSHPNRTECAYLTRVRITVQAGNRCVTREGTGFGYGASKNPSEAHERAIKAAETDATKRALATFGNRFGLALYDKEQTGVKDDVFSGREWKVFDKEGRHIFSANSPEGYCSSLRQIIERDDAVHLSEWYAHNRDGIDRLRAFSPQLKTHKGTHYADILLRIIERRAKELASEEQSEELNVLEQPSLAPSKITSGKRIDKSLLKLSTERKIRDKAHLKFVASHPCLICGRQPSHAHHLTFAQMRGVSQKVSDEFTVPLCALHHGALHQLGSECKWWEKMGLDPLPIALSLWSHSRPSFTSGDRNESAHSETITKRPTLTSERKELS